MKHLELVKESYFHHMKNAFKYSLKLFFASFAALVHAFYPQIFQNTASSIAKSVYSDVDKRISSYE